MEDKEWTPVRRGKTYCSPRCGAGCTHKAYLKAVKDAKALAKRCAKEIGGTWNIRVHENLGWHWSVVLDKANIEVDYGGYLASHGNYFTAALAGGTPIQVSIHPRTFKTPKAAFDAQMKAIKAEAKKWNDIINQVKIWTSPKR